MWLFSVLVSNKFFYFQLKTTQMWDYYVKAMIDLHSDLNSLASLKRNALYRAFHLGNESGIMSEDLYLQYIELLYSKRGGRQDNVLVSSRIIGFLVQNLD